MASAIDHVLQAHPWLTDPALAVCAVGSGALHEACRRAGLPLPPAPKDVDLAWQLLPADGLAWLAARGVETDGTVGALGRGTVAARLGDARVEITSYRGGGTDVDERIAADARLRDMTIGAIYWRLWDDRIADPLNGLEDWRHERIRACGDGGERIREHPIRAVRYLRRAAALGFWVDSPTRRAIRATAQDVARTVLPEALAEEVRRALATCPSPGVFFQACAEEQVLAPLLPEIAPQFDGRPAGRLRWHPEISQGLHLVLALHAGARLAEREHLTEDDRIRLLLAILCHDLGKGSTREADLPSHPGHEAAGVPVVDALFTRLPALGARRTQRVCRSAARTHLLLEKLRELKPGTLVDLWEQDLVPNRQDLVALARVVRCDREGRLDHQDLGLPCRDATRPDADTVEQRVLVDLYELDAILRGVSGEASARLHPDDPRALRRHLKETRCRAIATSGFLPRHRQG